MRMGKVVCSNCVLCGTEKKPHNAIVSCSKCGNGYHQKCHKPVITRPMVKAKVWTCKKCTGTGVKSYSKKRTITENTGTVEKKLVTALPYNPATLTWDNCHFVNAQGIYCYCGKSGDWYKNMLQCCRCRQWFHKVCAKSVKTEVLHGDRFFMFVCCRCNFGVEYFKTYQIEWVDMIHLSLFHLTIVKNQKYVEFNFLLEFINQNWNILRPSSRASNVSCDGRKSRIEKYLSSNVSRFQNAKEIRKRNSLWGLRECTPPPGPLLIFPTKGLITDSMLSPERLGTVATTIVHQARCVKIKRPLGRLAKKNKENDDGNEKSKKKILRKRMKAVKESKKQMAAKKIVNRILKKKRKMTKLSQLPAPAKSKEEKPKTPKILKRTAVSSGEEGDQGPPAKKRTKSSEEKSSMMNKLPFRPAMKGVTPVKRRWKKIPKIEANQKNGKSAAVKDLFSVKTEPVSTPKPPKPPVPLDLEANLTSLDAIIPPPVDFTGSNNPFSTPGDEKNKMAVKRFLKPGDAAEKPVKRGRPRKTVPPPTPPPPPPPPPPSKKRHRRTQFELLAQQQKDSELPNGRISTRNSSPDLRNGFLRNGLRKSFENGDVAKNRKSGDVTSKKRKAGDVGKNKRSTRRGDYRNGVRINGNLGKSFGVIGRRIGRDGRVQYLIEWKEES